MNKPEIHLRHCVFCETVTRGKGKNVNLNNVSSYFTIPRENEEEFYAELNFKAAISIYYKNPQKIYPVDLRIERPDGSEDLLSRIEREKELSTNDDDILSLGMFIYTTGIHWLRIYLDGEMFARIPFDVSVRYLGQNNDEDFQYYIQIETTDDQSDE